jgi:hypothetical protein
MSDFDRMANSIIDIGVLSSINSCLYMDQSTTNKFLLVIKIHSFYENQLVQGRRRPKSETRKPICKFYSKKHYNQLLQNKAF